LDTWKLTISFESRQTEKTLFVKLQVQDRTGAVITAIRHDIVHLEQPIGKIQFF
jgi:hypothetical protein